MSIKNLFLTVLACIFSCSFLLNTVSADENTEDLKKKIEALQRRVDELEYAQSATPARQTRWDPFKEMCLMQEEMDRMFQDSFGAMHGSGNNGIFTSDIRYGVKSGLREEKDKYIIEFDIKDLKNHKIDVKAANRSITVRGERLQNKTEEAQNRYAGYKSYSTFVKTIPVPADADIKRMKYSKKADKLIISLPKKKI